jgi:hypothetical protein
VVKQRLNSAGYTVIALGLLSVLSTVAAFMGTFAWLQGKDQINRLEDIATNTKDLLAERIKQNDEQAAERAAADADQARRQELANKIVEDAIRNIQLNTALSVDCAYLRDHGQRPAPCKEVNARIDQLQAGRPLTATTTTTTTPPARPPPPTTTSTTRVPTTTTSTTPPCSGINLLSICIGGS